jgi:hypothetical protein
LLECSQCNTLNPNAEAACLACGTPLAASATGVSGATDRCPAGHAVDPGWKTCPYCDRLAGGATNAGATNGGGRATRLDGTPPANPAKTRLEPAAARPGAGGPTRLPGEAAPAREGGPARTRLEPPEAPRGRPTVLSAAGGAASPEPSAAAAAAPREPIAAASAARRLVGVLAAPDLGPGGTVFPVRAGRNVLGSGPGSDVLLDGDGEVSREHAVLLHRQDAFHLADRLSTNGTWVNGREVPANGTVPLADRDRIRLGGTELLFLRVDVAGEPGDDQP